MNNYFFQGETDDPGYNRLFSYNPLLQTHSNQEHNNAINHPTFTESIEQLVEQIIHSVLVRTLSNWDCVLHVCLFLAEFLEEILDLLLLSLFSW